METTTVLKLSRRFRQCLTLCVLLTPRSNSVGIRNLRIDDLVSASDVIAIVEIADVKNIGAAQPILFRGQLLQAVAYSSDLSVRRMIKGSVPDHITVRYALPISFVGYHGLHQGIRLAFLKREQDNYGLADPYYSDFPAVIEGSHSASGDYTSAVIREMLAVIGSPTVSPAEKSEILRVDYALPSNAEVIAAFREGLASAHEAELKQRLLGELLRFGDVDELPDVAHLLLTNTATDSQRVWLLYVIGNRLNDRRAIPALQPLLKSGDSSVRGAAVEALWHIADPEAVPSLSRALNDPDEQVRFYAVRALSDIANEAGWGGPSEAEFHEHQQKYLTHWQDWAKTRGQ